MDAAVSGQAVGARPLRTLRPPRALCARAACLLRRRAWGSGGPHRPPPSPLDAGLLGPRGGHGSQGARGSFCSGDPQRPLISTVPRRHGGAALRFAPPLSLHQAGPAPQGPSPHLVRRRLILGTLAGAPRPAGRRRWHSSKQARPRLGHQRQPARGQTRLSAPRRCRRCGRVGLIDLGRGLCPVCSRRPSSTPVSVHWMPVPPPLVGAQAATRHICRRRRVSREHGLDPAESRRLFPRRFHSLASEVGEVLASFCQGQSGTEAFAKEAPGRAGGSWCRWPSPHPPVATVPAGPGRRVPPFIVEGF